MRGQARDEEDLRLNVLTHTCDYNRQMLRPEDLEFKATLGNRMTLSQKNAFK